MAGKQIKYAFTHKGLATGNHHFTFDIQDAFFEAFPENGIRGGACTADIDLEKSNNLLKLTVRIKGKVEVTCDRCLDYFYEPVDYEGQLLVKFSNEITGFDENYSTDPNTELLWVNPDENEIDLTQYLYDSIMLSLPIQHVHPEDENGISGCDPDMLSRFVRETDGGNDE